MAANANGKGSERARNAALFVPLVLVNSFAVFGQAAWAYDKVTPSHWNPFARWTLAALFACAVESIGVYLAVEAHAALMGDQASGLLRTGSYAVGAFVGALNFDHWAGAHRAVTAAAVTFGALSAISPWLWAIRSRSMNRDRLRELRLLDERGVKLSTSRKFWHPVRSLQVVRWAAWAGVTEPAAAVAGWSAASTPSLPKPAKPQPEPRSAVPVPVAPAKAPPAGPTPERPSERMQLRMVGGRGGARQRTTAQQRERALALLAEGVHPMDVAKTVLVSKRTVEIWRRNEANGGGAHVDVANS